MTDEERTAAEIRGLLRFARGLGLDEATVREIYETVGREAMVTGASDDDRMAEVRKRMLAAVRQRARKKPRGRSPEAVCGRM